MCYYPDYMIAMILKYRNGQIKAFEVNRNVSNRYYTWEQGEVSFISNQTRTVLVCLDLGHHDRVLVRLESKCSRLRSCASMMRRRGDLSPATNAVMSFKESKLLNNDNRHIRFRRSHTRNDNTVNPYYVWLTCNVALYNRYASQLPSFKCGAVPTCLSR